MFHAAVSCDSQVLLDNQATYSGVTTNLIFSEVVYGSCPHNGQTRFIDGLTMQAVKCTVKSSIVGGLSQLSTGCTG